MITLEMSYPEMVALRALLVKERERIWQEKWLLRCTRAKKNTHEISQLHGEYLHKRIDKVSPLSEDEEVYKFLLQKIEEEEKRIQEELNAKSQ